jgi:NADH-quinone oxidoreductase subunit G
MDHNGTLTIDGRLHPVGTHKNLLEVIRSAGIDLPTFCYHSDLSVYSSCRLCMVEVEGRGIVTSCMQRPEPGMIVRTNTAELRRIRRILVELLLASHKVDCPSCPKAVTCQLQRLASRLGVGRVRYRHKPPELPIDESSQALVRDGNKCVLCGDCVRMCNEVQGIGVLEFAHRGSRIQVLPPFGHGLAHVECVDCGQCAAVCPTGALTPKSHVDRVWKALHDPTVKVVAQVAPAVRVGIGEAFGLEPGQSHIGQVVRALRAMGFDRVYDTAFAADLTVVEEGTEFLKRLKERRGLPQFASCCPAWVKMVELHYPDRLENLSSCRSPQQMFGSLAKRHLPQSELGVTADKVFVVSIMPCTAKKFESSREEFHQDGVPDVDAVLTTQELVQMIKEVGLDFAALEPDRLDMPYGFKSGAGVLFGTTGGVAEAILRFAGTKLVGRPPEPVAFSSMRGMEACKEAVVHLGDVPVRVAVVHGLAAARSLLADIAADRRAYDLVEVMACPGGCVGGAGQPPARDARARAARQDGIYQSDTMLQMQSSEENPYLRRLYEEVLGEPSGELAHGWLHTQYRSRRRTTTHQVELAPNGEAPIKVEVCVGTNCHLSGSHRLLRRLLDHLEQTSQGHLVDVTGTFCNEVCDRGPAVRVNGHILEKCTIEQLVGRVEAELAGIEQTSSSGKHGG